MAIFLALFLRLLSILPAVIDDDEAYFWASAAALKHPAQFFQRAVDNKPAGTAWFYWAVGKLTGFAALGHTARFAQLALLAFAAWTLAEIARGMKRDADSTALLFLLALPLASPKLLSVTNEGLLLCLLCPAFWLLWPGTTERRRLAPLVAGILAGMALLTKQTAVFFLPALIVLAAEAGAIATLVIAAGAVTAAGIALLGPADFWFWSFVFPREVLAVRRQLLFTSTLDGLKNLRDLAIVLWPLLLAMRLPTAPKRQRTALNLWLGGAVAAVALGRGLFSHYFLLLLPPLVIFAVVGDGARALRGWRGAWLWAGYSFACLVAAVPSAGLFWGSDLAYFARVAERARALTAPEDAVVFWGGNPIPAAFTRRPSIGPFVTVRFAAPPYSTPRTEALFRDAFLQQPPALIVDTSTRGDNRFDYELAVMPWLADAVARDYVAYADPDLPWVRYFLRKGRPAGDLCPAAAGVWKRPESQYPQMHQRFAIAQADAKVLWKQDKELRACYADEIARQVCAVPQTPRRPFARQSPSWWISQAIVEMQPVAVPRQ